MPQSPLLVDALQIEPGTSTYGSRTISRDTSDGGLEFEDPNVTAALKDLVGMRNITGVFIVGRAGDGSPYTAIQDALDDVPDTSSSSAPSLVWVLPGVYTENIVIQKDGVILASLGGSKIINSGADDTVTVSASLDTTPLYTLLRGLEIENDQASQACIKVEGADSFATGTVTVNTAPLAVGDTVTINGTPLTGVAGTRTSGSNDFSVDGSTVGAIAAEISAALNDTSNSFATLVEASVLAAVVTLDAVTPGAGGNSITLAVSTTPAAGLTASGAALAGGGASGSLVASEGLVVDGCILVASAAGGYQINADTANDLRVQGGTWRGSSSTSTCIVVNCASLRIQDVDWSNDFNLSYDTANDEPNNSPSEYSLKSCGTVGDLTVDLDGAGALVIGSCPEVGDVIIGGDRSFSAAGSSFGDMTLSDTVAASLDHCSRGTATGATATLEESSWISSQAFVASASEAVAFDVDQPDTSYMVSLESPTTTATLGVSSKTASGFTIDASGAITGTVGYAVLRKL